MCCEKSSKNNSQNYTTPLGHAPRVNAAAPASPTESPPPGSVRGCRCLCVRNLNTLLEPVTLLNQALLASRPLLRGLLVLEVPPPRGQSGLGIRKYSTQESSPITPICRSYGAPWHSKEEEKLRSKPHGCLHCMFARRPLFTHVSSVEASNASAHKRAQQLTQNTAPLRLFTVNETNTERNVGQEVPDVRAKNDPRIPVSIALHVIE